MHNALVQARGPEHARMQEVADMYNGEIAVPLPELNREERNMVENRTRIGLQQIGNRVTSVLPNISTPVVRPAIKESQDRAKARRKAWLGLWKGTGMKGVLRQRSRFLLGYGLGPVEIKWDFKRNRPMWFPLNPLHAYSSSPIASWDVVPEFTIHEAARSWKWLMARYPGQMMQLGAVNPHQQNNPDRQYNVLKYVDENECVLVVVSRQDDDGGRQGVPGDPKRNAMEMRGGRGIDLERYPNVAKVTTAVWPRVTTLSQAHGWFDGQIGMHRAEAMLTSMSIIATKKGVFVDEWLIGRANEEPEIRQVPNAYTGEPGIVTGGELVPRGVDPQFQTNITIDRLAEAQRMSAGLSPELQGMAPTNVRTGRRAAQLLGAAIDFTVQECQELFEESLEHENRIAAAFLRGMDDGQPRSFYMNWRGEAATKVTYKVAEVFETDESIVRYAFPGTDADSLSINGLQRVGAGTLSKETFMAIDPMVEDGEQEKDRVRAEAIEMAFVSSIQSLAANPEGPWQPVDFARLTELIVSDEMELYEAVQQVHKEAQERQAPAVEPVPQGVPEAMPGLSPPGQGAEAAAIQEPQPSAQNLSQMLMSLRGPRMELPVERGAV
jgi:hypothetical protein